MRPGLALRAILCLYLRNTRAIVLEKEPACPARRSELLFTEWELAPIGTYMGTHVASWHIMRLMNATGLTGCATHKNDERRAPEFKFPTENKHFLCRQRDRDAVGHSGAPMAAHPGHGTSSLILLSCGGGYNILFSPGRLGFSPHCGTLG